MAIPDVRELQNRFVGAPPDRVYVDPSIHSYGRMVMCHMFSKNMDSLHRMADRIGVARKWFQSKSLRFPHYDVCKSMRAKAVSLGAVELDKYEMVALVRQWRSEVARVVAEQPAWCCPECGIAHGQRDFSKPSTQSATFHKGECGVCGQMDFVTEPRDYGYLRLPIYISKNGEF